MICVYSRWISAVVALVQKHTEWKTKTKSNKKTTPEDTPSRIHRDVSRNRYTFSVRRPGFGRTTSTWSLERHVRWQHNTRVFLAVRPVWYTCRWWPCDRPKCVIVGFTSAARNGIVAKSYSPWRFIPLPRPHLSRLARRPSREKRIADGHRDDVFACVALGPVLPTNVSAGDFPTENYTL